MSVLVGGAQIFHTHEVEVDRSVPPPGIAADGSKAIPRTAGDSGVGPTTVGSFYNASILGNTSMIGRSKNVPLVRCIDDIRPSGVFMWQPAAQMVPRTVRVTPKGGVYICDAHRTEEVLQVFRLQDIVSLLPMHVVTINTLDNGRSGEQQKMLYAVEETPVPHSMAVMLLPQNMEERKKSQGNLLAIRNEAEKEQGVVGIRLVFAKRSEMTKFSKLVKQHSTFIQSRLQEAKEAAIAASRMTFPQLDEHGRPMSGSVSQEGSGSSQGSSAGSVMVPQQQPGDDVDPGPEGGGSFFRNNSSIADSTFFDFFEEASPAADGQPTHQPRKSTENKSPQQPYANSKNGSSGDDEDDDDQWWNNTLNNHVGEEPEDIDAFPQDAEAMAAEEQANAQLLNPLAVCLPEDVLINPMERVSLGKRQVPFNLALQSTLAESCNQVDMEDYFEVGEMLRKKQAASDRRRAGREVDKARAAARNAVGLLHETVSYYSPQKERATQNEFLFGHPHQQSPQALQQAAAEEQQLLYQRRYGRSSMSNVFPDAVCPKIYGLMTLEDDVL